MQLSVLERLSAAGKSPVDTARLGDTLSLTPVQLQEAIDGLVAHGCIIKKESHQVVRLYRTGISTWKDYLENRLGDRYRVQVYAQTGSTQDVAARLAMEMSSGDLGLVIAGNQTQGRGRLNRKWYSKENQSLTFSWVMMEPDFKEIRAERLTLGAGVALCQGIEKACSKPSPALQMKWPNDIYLGDRKLAGILIETRRIAEGKIAWIVGVGVNMETSSYMGIQHQGLAMERNERGFKSVSLKQAGYGASRVVLCRHIAQSLEKMIDAEAKAILDAWHQRCDMIGKEMAFSHDGHVYRGMVMQLCPEQGLILQTADGSIIHLPSRSTSTHLD